MLPILVKRLSLWLGHPHSCNYKLSPIKTIILCENLCHRAFACLMFIPNAEFECLLLWENWVTIAHCFTIFLLFGKKSCVQMSVINTHRYTFIAALQVDMISVFNYIQILFLNVSNTNRDHWNGLIRLWSIFSDTSNTVTAKTSCVFIAIDCSSSVIINNLSFRFCSVTN